MSNMEKKVDTLVKSQDTLAQVLSRIEIQLSQQKRQRGTLPSQPLPNPRNPRPANEAQDPNQCHMVHTLRSGKQVDNQVSMPLDPSMPSIPSSSTSIPSSSTPAPSSPTETEAEKSAGQLHQPIAPFPNRLRSNNNAHMEKLLEVFNQVRLNIPLLDAIQHVPSYAKFLKDMCTKKRKTNVPKKVFLATNISELLSNQIPIKYKDPGCPTISCTIGRAEINRALLDLGASINLLPFSVYQQLGLGELNPTQVTIQLADRSIKVPKGEINDVLIRVGEFIYPVDFIVLETQPVSNPRSQTPVILGRPFLATANAIINCRNGSMRLTFGDMTKEVNVFNLGKHPYDVTDQPFEVNFIENMTSEHNEEITLESKEEDELGSSDLNLDEIEWAANPSSIEMENSSLTPPPIEPHPSLELKTLPKHLKYAYLGEQETLLVIVASNLTNRQEEDLLATP